MKRNKDFELCADFGLADRIRKITTGYDKDTLQKIHAAFDKYLKFGVMPFTPNIVGIFAEVYNPKQSKEANAHNIEVARDTLFSIMDDMN